MTDILIVGEAWGDNEAILKRPFVGASGVLLLNLLDQSGIIGLTPDDRANISQYYKTKNPYFIGLIWDTKDIKLTNVFNLQPRPKNDIKNLCTGSRSEAIPNMPALQRGYYVRAEYGEELIRLYQEVRRINPNIVIALGGTAAWALTGRAGIKSARGTCVMGMTGHKTLPTYHPAGILRQWSTRPIAISDLAKAHRQSRFPEMRLPQREVWIEPTLEDLFTFESKYIDPEPELSVDLENVGSIITCIGFAPRVDICLVVPFLDVSKPDGNYWPDHESELIAWNWVRKQCNRGKRIVGQNFISDMLKLWSIMGIPAPNTEDTMLLHHALFPEMEKGLAFLGSVYTDEASWKMHHQTMTKKKGD